MEPLSKPLQAAADLDAARCRGDWTAIPELAKRYKKYHPDESVLELAACLEAEYLIRGGEEKTSNSERKSIWSTSSNHSASKMVTPEEDLDSIHRHDDPDHIALAPRLNLASSQAILSSLQNLVQKQGNAQELQTTDDWQAQFVKIIIARIYFESGSYREALDSLQNLALRMEDVHSGYGMVLLVQARVIKGTCLEQLGHLTAALEAFEAAWDVVQQHPAEKNDVLSYWIEQGLYRAILLWIRINGPAKSILPLMRGYMHMASSHWSSFWRMHKRWIIFRHYGRYLIKTYQDGSYFPMDIEKPPTRENQGRDQASAYEELLCLTALYRNLLSSLASKMSTEEFSQYVLELANLMVEAHDAIGWGEISNVKRVLQFLHSAKENTFNNPCIARHIFFTLMRLGNFEEANHALRWYMELVGVPDIDKTAQDHQTDNNTAAGTDKAVDQIRKKLAAVRKVHYKQHQYETELDIVRVLLAGVQLYGRESKTGKMATVVADIALELLLHGDENPGLCKEEWIAEAYRMRGAAYGLCATQCDDPDRRASYHREAIGSLEKTVEMDNTSWKALYELAVQQAQVKDVAAASVSVRKSLQLNPDHLPSWHLLSLIYSCKQISQSLRIIQARLDGYNSIIPSNVNTGMPVLSWSSTGKEQCSRSYFDAAEAYLLLLMAQMDYLEALEGPDTALDLYQDLFATYNNLSQALGMAASPAPNRSSSGKKQRRLSASSRRPSDTTSTADASILPSSDEESSTADRGQRTRKRSLIDLGLGKRFGANSQVSPQQNGADPESTVPVSLTPSFSVSSARSSQRSPAASKSTDTVSSSSYTNSNSTFLQYQRQRWRKLLVKLWLRCSKSFIKAGRLEEASKALVEAEQLGTMDPDVWHQLGVLCLFKYKTEQGDDLERALDAFKKALMLDPYHTAAQVDLASAYIDIQEWELALGLLDQATQGGPGWDNAEAWYLLGTVYKEQGDFARAKECLLYALELDESTPIGSFRELPRFV